MLCPSPTNHAVAVGVAWVALAARTAAATEHAGGVVRPGAAVIKRDDSGGAAVSPARKSVLHMVADDMRPEMRAAYNQSHLVTPAFDKRAPRRALSP
jgi:hypothetical protein